MAQPNARVAKASGEGSDPERLRWAEAAFDAGDHRALRDQLDRLRASEQPEVRARAEQLARAISADPAFAVVTATCALGLVAACVHYILG